MSAAGKGAMLSDPGMVVDAKRTAVVITDPQNDFLSPDGVTWGLVAASVEAHMRELLEQGFEVAVVKDATAAAQTPEIAGFAAALTNFRFLASTMWTVEEATSATTAAASN